MKIHYPYLHELTPTTRSHQRMPFTHRFLNPVWTTTRQEEAEERQANGRFHLRQWWMLDLAIWEVGRRSRCPKGCRTRRRYEGASLIHLPTGDVSLWDRSGGGVSMTQLRAAQAVRYARKDHFLAQWSGRTAQMLSEKRGDDTSVDVVCGSKCSISKRPILRIGGLFLI